MDKATNQGALTGFQRLLETGLIISAALAVFLLFALMSFHPADPSWSQTGNPNQIHNYMGAVGAWSADVLLFALGYISYTIPFAISFVGWMLFKRFHAVFEIDYLTLGLRLIGGLLLLLSTTAIVSFYAADLHHFSSGGVVGDVVRNALVPFFNVSGSLLILLAAWLTGVTLFTGFSWLTLVDFVGAMAVNAWFWLLGLIKDKQEQRHEQKQQTAQQTQIVEETAFEQVHADEQQVQEPHVSEPVTQATTQTQIQTMPSNTVQDDADGVEHVAGDSTGDIADDSVDSYLQQAMQEQQAHSTQAQSAQPTQLDPEPTIDLTNAPPQEKIEPKINVALEDILVEDEQPYVDFEQLIDEPIAYSTVEEQPIDDDVASALESLQMTTNSQNELEVEQTILAHVPENISGGQVPEEPLTGFAKVMAEAREDVGEFPTIELLDKPERSKNPISQEDLDKVSRLVEAKLLDFNVIACVVGVFPGPVITRFELDLAPGVKVSKITGLAKDLARALSAISVRVVEVIPGKSVIGLELPNKHREIVRLSEVITCPAFVNSSSPLTMVLGSDISGDPVTVDLGKMPHLLVAGTTGSGKSVGVNTMILSLLYKAKPEDVRMLMIDPKILELSVYEGIPHLLTEVVTDMKEAANGLRWCVGEMERRYKLMSALGVRNLKGFNAKILKAQEDGTPIRDPLWKDTDSMDEVAPMLEKLPSIVVIIDEFADMMMIVGKKVEELIARIAQKARAAGIHLVLATQRPSVDVITGLIKANIPTRIAFQVSSRIDSRTILDQQGAESLLGMGDMLYLPPGTSVPTRVHGAFVDDHEVHAVVDNWKKRGKPNYIAEILSDDQGEDAMLPGEVPEGGDQENDEFYDQAVAFVCETRRASVSSVQRKFRIGYNRAARIVEQMQAAGVVSAPAHNGNREVLVAPPPQN